MPRKDFVVKLPSAGAYRHMPGILEKAAESHNLGIKSRIGFLIYFYLKLLFIIAMIIKLYLERKSTGPRSLRLFIFSGSSNLGKGLTQSTELAVFA